MNKYRKGEYVIVQSTGQPGKVRSVSTQPNGTRMYGIRLEAPDERQKDQRRRSRLAVDLYATGDKLDPHVTGV